MRTKHPYVTSRFVDQLEMVRPSRQLVPASGVPDGYALRVFREGDEAAYEELFVLAWPDEGTLAYTREHALRDGFFVVEHVGSGKLVASCVAFGPQSPQQARDGSLGWLVVDPAHARRGLGTLVAAAVTNRLVAAGYAMPWLGTEDDRIAAIGIYLRLGWEPHLYSAGMEGRGRDIFRELDRT